MYYINYRLYNIEIIQKKLLLKVNFNINAWVLKSCYDRSISKTNSHSSKKKPSKIRDF